MKQKIEEEIEMSLEEKQRNGQILENVAIGCIYLSVCSATLLAVNGIQAEVYDLQRNNPYDLFGIASLVTSQKGYMETEKRLEEMTTNLYATEDPYYQLDFLHDQIKNGVRNERKSIYEMLEACPNETVRTDIVKLMTVVSENENLTVNDIEGYFRTIPFLMDLLNMGVLNQHDFANYLAEQDSLYETFKQMDPTMEAEELKQLTQEKTIVKVVDYMFYGRSQEKTTSVNELRDQVRTQVLTEYFCQHSFLQYTTFYPKFYPGDIRMSTMMNDLVSNDVVLKAVIEDDVTELQRELYKIIPDREQVEDLLWASHVSYMGGFLQEVEPFYEAKFQMPTREMPLWQFYRLDSDMDNHLSGPVVTRLVKPCYNSELIQNIADPYIEVEYYDAYLAEHKLTVSEYQALKNQAIYEQRYPRPLIDYTMKQTKMERFHGLYPNVNHHDYSYQKGKKEIQKVSV